MNKNKITKIVVNGVLLAALAAIGITAFQLGTSSVREEIVPQEIQLAESTVPEETEEPLVDVETSRVEASMETPASDQDAAAEDQDAAGGELQENAVDMETVDTADTSAVVHEVPALNFSEDSLMIWPVNGNILLDYDMEQTTYFPTLDQYRLSSAIAVQAGEGAPVMAAAPGTVFSVAQDAKTGTTVTMELGNGYQAIYGQLKDLQVAEGDTVTAGQIIGYIGAPTKYYSVEGSNLYFAMKKDGQPIDPILYLP